MFARSKGLFLSILLALLLTACGGSGRSDRSDNQNQSSTQSTAPVPAPERDGRTDGDSDLFRGFGELPEDRPLPGEELNAEGEVIPASAGDRAGMTRVDPLSGARAKSRTVSASPAPPTTRFAPGALRVSGSAANTLVNSEGLKVRANQNVTTAYAAYRLNSSNGDPALVTTDLNVPAGAEYYLALADYGQGRWRWKGPFTDGRLRFTPESPGDLVSGSGNTFVAVVTTSTTGVDVAGVGLQLAEDSGSEGPEAPVNLSASSAAGGVVLDWDGVGNTSDLAGYRIYRSSTAFSSKDRAFSTGDGLITGRSDAFIETDSGEQLHFRVTAVDTSGSESDLSGAASATPGSGSPASGALQVSRVAGPRGATVDLDASSIPAESYDWDTDGDGEFEEQGVSTATKENIQLTDNAGQPASGLLRPAVRAKNGDGEVTLFASASVFFPSNFRPVVEKIVLDQASLQGSGTVTAEAHFSDSDGQVQEIIWDTNDDGSFEQSSQSTGSPLGSPQSKQISFSSSGLKTVRVKVTDDKNKSSWSSTQVLVEPSTTGQPQITGADASPNPQTPGSQVDFSATATDPDGSIQSYQWDFGDGNSTTEQNPSHTYSAAGSYTAKLTVTDGDGNTDVSFITVNVKENPANIPPTIDSASATPSSGKPGVSVNFSASASDSDGSVSSYAWDFTNDGTDEGTGSSASNTYSNAGFNTVKLTVTDDDGATSTAYLGVDVEHNLAPRIDQFTSLPANRNIFAGITELEVSLQSQHVSDPDGPDSALEYSWDLRGNGSFGPFSSDDFTTGKVFRAGTISVGVRVKDADGAISRATAPVISREFTETPGPRRDTFEDENDTIAVDRASGLALNPLGQPAVVYQRVDESDNSGTEKCAISTNDSRTGRGSWKHNFIDSSVPCDGVGTAVGPANTALEVPLLAAYDESTTPDSLHFSKSSAVDGLGSWNTHKVKDLASGSSVTDADSIDIVNTSNNVGVNKILIAFVEDNHLWVAISDDFSPTSSTDWTTYEIVPGSSNSGLGPVGEISLVQVGAGGSAGQPAIAFHEEDDGHLWWIVADRGAPTQASHWGSAQLVDGSTAGVGTELDAGANIDCDNGCTTTPMIAYHENVDEKLKFATSSTDTGSSAGDWSTQVVAGDESFVNLGSDPKLLQADTRPSSPTGGTPPRPTIFYRDEDTGDIKLAQRMQPPLPGWHTGRVASYGAGGADNLELLGGNLPAVFTPETDSVSPSEEFFSYIRPLE